MKFIFYKNTKKTLLIPLVFYFFYFFLLTKDARIRATIKMTKIYTMLLSCLLYSASMLGQKPVLAPVEKPSLLAQTDNATIIHELQALLEADESKVNPESLHDLLKLRIQQTRIVERSETCTTVAYPEHIWKARQLWIELKRRSIHATLPLLINERSAGAAWLRFYYSGAPTDATSLATTAVSNLNARFVSAGFAPNQFQMCPTTPVMTSIAWPGTVNADSLGPNLLEDFATYIDIYFPPSSSGPHINCGIYNNEYGEMLDALAITYRAFPCNTTSLCNTGDVWGPRRSYMVIKKKLYLQTNNVFLAHEVGHNMSLPHNNTPNDPSSCSSVSGVGNLFGYVMSGAGSSTTWHPTTLSRLNAAVAWNNAQGDCYPLFAYTPLAGELRSFVAHMLSGVVSLAWETNTLPHIKGYELQRSRDGITFETISYIDHDESQTHYSYIDTRPIVPQSYYRLRILRDGGLVALMSDIVVVSERAQETPYFHVYGQRVEFSVHRDGDVVQIFDIMGKLVGKSNTSSSVELPAGVYVVFVNGSSASKILIQ